MKVLIELKLPEDAVFSDAYGAIQQASKMEIISAKQEPSDTLQVKLGETYLTSDIDALGVKNLVFPDGHKFLWSNVRPSNPDCIGLKVAQIGNQYVFIGVMREGWEPIKTH